MQGLIFFLLPILKNFINPDSELEVFVHFKVSARCD